MRPCSQRSRATRNAACPARFAGEVAAVSGTVELADGSRETITRETLILGNEAALRAFALAMVALAVALAVLRAQ